MLGNRGLKARVSTATLSDTMLKNWTNVSRASLPKFAKAMAALDRHLKHDDSNLFMAKDREFVIADRYWRESKRSSRKWPRKTAKCNKSTYRSRLRAGMEKSCTWRTKSKVSHNSRPVISTLPIQHNRTATPACQKV